MPKGRFDDKWDYDFGYVLIWFFAFACAASIIWAIAWAGVSTNARNNAKEELFYKSCKQVDVVKLADNSKRTYECK